MDECFCLDTPEGLCDECLNGITFNPGYEIQNGKIYTVPYDSEDFYTQVNDYPNPCAEILLNEKTQICQLEVESSTQAYEEACYPDLFEEREI